MIEPKSLYKYDALYRLKKATGREHNSLANLTNNDFVNNIIRPEDGTNMRNFTQEYKYDQIGNLLQMKSNGVWTRDYMYDFATNNHLLKHDENATINSYEYDAHGNTTKMPHLQELKYDYADQLNEVTLNLDGNKAYYIYNAEGERVRKVIEKGNIIEERFYLGDYEICSKKTNGTLDVERETLHINDDKQKVALIDYDGTTTTIRYQLTNHLDSASLELDHNAEIISYEEYHPFGTTSYRSGRNEIDVSLKRYKYVHKELDNETGLYYYGMRYYAPWVARFISVDPLQFDYPIYTPFQYAGNQPIIAIDIDGLEPKKIIEYQKNIVRGAMKLKTEQGSLKFGFQKRTGQFNSKYWELEGNYIKTKQGVKPSKAVSDVFKNPDNYSAECAQGVQLLNWYARLKTYGKKEFNKLGEDSSFILNQYNATGNETTMKFHRSAKNKPWIDLIQDKKNEKAYLKSVEEKDFLSIEAIKAQQDYLENIPIIEFDVESKLNEIPIGSRVMLGNMDENVYRTAWAHENITKIGDDLWYAHPFGAFSLDEIKKKFANEAGDISQEYIKENIYIQTIETFKQEK